MYLKSIEYLAEVLSDLGEDVSATVKEAREIDRADLGVFITTESLREIRESLIEVLSEYPTLQVEISGIWEEEVKVWKEWT